MRGAKKNRPVRAPLCMLQIFVITYCFSYFAALKTNKNDMNLKPPFYRAAMLFIALLVSIPAARAEVYSGDCGNYSTNVQWRFDTETGLLSITGTGKMKDYTSNAPWYKYSDYIKTIEIADGVTSIGDLVFSRCSELSSVTIPYSVTSIGKKAFEWCSGLTSITIPNSVISIGSSAFEGCSGLTSIEIPNSVTKIEDNTFEWCSSLTSVTTPYSVTKIGNYAFYGCSGLTSIAIPNSVIYIHIAAFLGCTNLKDVRIEDSTESLIFTHDIYSGNSAFDNCPIETLYLGRNISYDSWTSPFRGKTTLSSVTIGNSVTEIGEDAFRNCSGLTSVTVDIATPLNISSYVFSDSNYKNCTLYVPAGSVELYNAAEVWKEFEQILPIEGAGVETIDADAPKCYVVPDGALAVDGLATGTRIVVYDMSGTLVRQAVAGAERTEIALPARGVHVVRIGSHTQKVIL